MRLALCVAAMLSVCAYAQETGRVEGRVVSTTGEPVRKAIVRLSHTSERPATYLELTAADGSFVIADLPPEYYSITVSKEGFNGGAPKSVHPKAGETIRDFTITVRPRGSISGVVTDADGDPVPGATLTLYPAGSGLSGRGSTWGNAIADGRGQFYFRADPGLYYLTAHVSTSLFTGHPYGETHRGTNAQRVPLRTFYPNEASPALAQPITVNEGAETTGITVRLRQGNLVALRGRVAPVDPAPKDGWMVHVSSDDDPYLSVGGYVVRPNGEFAVQGLPAGSYTLRVQPSYSSDPETISGVLQVTADASDVNDLVVPLLPNIDVTGHIVVEGEDEAEFQSPVVGFADPSRMGYSQTNASSDGRFAKANLRRERYWLSVTSGTGLYLTSLRVAGMELQDGTLDLRAGPPPGPVEIVMARGAGRVTGPWPERLGTGATALVVLWPKSPQKFHREQGVRDSKDWEREPQFWFQDVPPGDYFVAVFEQVPFHFRDALRFLNQFNNTATAITVAPGTTVTVEPKLIPREAVATAIGNLR